MLEFFVVTVFWHFFHLTFYLFVRYPGIGMWFGVPFVCVGAGMSLMQISRMLGMSLGESLDSTEFLIIAAQISVVTFFCFILVAMLLKAIQQYFRKIRNRNQ
jgi:hypothetical protein